MKKMIYLTVIAIFCAIIFFILWLILSCQLKRMTYQLKENTEKDLDTKISISLLYERLSNLTQKINNLIEQKQIVQAAQLSSERELKEAISSMSHDLRTPLTAIIGYIQLAKQDDLSTDKRDEYLTVAKERSFQLQRLIQNFFSLSVVESSEHLLNMEKNSLTKIVREKILSFYDELNEHIKSVKVEIPEEDIFIFADQVACERIVENLLLNVIHHGEEKIVISLEQRDGFGWFIIKNNMFPRGVSTEHIFDKFYIADETRKYSGGLGLAIVKNLMNKMNAKVDVVIENNAFIITCTWKLYKQKNL